MPETVIVPVPDPQISRSALRRVVWRTVAILAVLLAIGIVIDAADTPSTSWTTHLVRFVVILGIGSALAEAYVRIATRLWPSGQVPVPVNIATAILGSVIGFGLSALVGLAFGKPVPPASWPLIVEVFIAGPTWIMLIGTAVLTYWRYQAQRDTLIADLVDVELIRRREIGMLDAARNQLQEPITAALSTLRASVASHASSLSERTLSSPVVDGEGGEADAALAHELRRAAQQVIRPLSHAVWRRADLPPTPKQPFRFLARVIATQPFRPGLISAVYVASAFATNVEIFGLARGTLYLATDVAFIVAVLGAANVAMRRWPPVHTWIYLATLVVVHVLPLLPKAAGLEETNPQFSGSARIAEIIISVALILGTSSLGLLRQGRDARLAALEAEVDAEWVARQAEAAELAELARATAAALHGPVQSTLLTAASRIEHAAGVHDRITIEECLAEVLRALQDADPFSSAPSDIDADTRERLDSLIEPWSELCTFTVNLDTTIASTKGALTDTVIGIIREAITNAYRHGDARSITIAATQNGDHVDIMVIDDGIGPGDKVWGLGLTTVDRVTQGRWTLTREDDSTVLRARVPVSLERDLSTAKVR